MIVNIDRYQKISDRKKIELIKLSGDMGHFEEIAYEAFENKGSTLWKELQFLLFSLNLSLMDNGFALGVSRSESEWKIRNIIERAEQKHLTQEKVPNEINSPEEFLAWLKQRISEHAVNHHTLFDYFDADDLNEEELRYFLANYRVNMQRFHLHVAAYSLFVPFKMREELYNNLYDEFGQGDFNEAHPNLFEPLMDYFGG